MTHIRKRGDAGARAAEYREVLDLEFSFGRLTPPRPRQVLYPATSFGPGFLRLTFTAATTTEEGGR
jgi:hypothetical protein